MELKNFFAQDDQGNKLSGATCYLYQRGTESLVGGLVKANGASLSNPFITDQDGLIQFAAANGLYDIRVVAGVRDYRLSIQFGDVTEMVLAAETAARQSESARDTFNLNVGRKPDVSTGLVQTVPGQTFTVLAASSADYIVEYENRGGVAVEVKRYPSAEAVKALDETVKGFYKKLPGPFMVRDKYRRVAFQVRANGKSLIHASEDSTFPGAFARTEDIKSSPFAFSIRDSRGRLSDLTITKAGRFAEFVKAGFSGRRYDLRSLVKGGSRLPNDGISDESSGLLSEAFIKAHDRAMNDGYPIQISVPAGQYRLTTEVTQLTKVGVDGAGRNDTIFLPVGAASAFKSPVVAGASGTDFEDVCYTNLTIDGRLQTFTGANSTIKGFFIQKMTRPTFARVNVINTWATGFGMDFLRDALVLECYAGRCGRQGGSRVDTGAGFGFATGFFEDEFIAVIGCIGQDNLSHGLFTEMSGRVADQPGYPEGRLSRGMVVMGSRFSGNYTGILDAGSFGMYASGNLLSRNEKAGIMVDTNAAAVTGGKLAMYVANTISKNGLGDPNGGGVVFGQHTRSEAKDGASFIHNLVTENESGFIAPEGAKVGKSLKIQGGVVAYNRRCGIALLSANTLIRPHITDVQVVNNGQDTSAELRDGVHIKSPMVRPRLNDIEATDWQTVKTQQRGLVLSGPAITVKPRIQSNDLDGNAGAGLVIEHAIADTSYITGNIED